MFVKLGSVVYTSKLGSRVYTSAMMHQLIICKLYYKIICVWKFGQITHKDPLSDSTSLNI